MAETNEVIGGYRLRSLIQSGNESQVFEVIEPLSNRHFAMKILLPEKSKDKGARATLFHEAAIGIALRHENVISISKVSKDENNPFFIMEYFPAGSLRGRLLQKDYKFIQTHARKIFRAVATGLAYMHGSDYVHRDVKPDNLLVNALGELKLIDFAISRKVEKPGMFAGLFGDKKKGKPAGTPSFMSPEQILNTSLDGRSDIYSLGVTYFELATGRKPFTGNTQQELLEKHFSQKPDSPAAHNKLLTEEFGKIVMRMMSKKKEDRYQSCHEVLMDLKKTKIYKDEPDIDPEMSY